MSRRRRSKGGGILEFGLAGIPMIFANVKPVLFSSTLDTDGQRQFQTGEFVETVDQPGQSK